VTAITGHEELRHAVVLRFWQRETEPFGLGGEEFMR
jgi:hypothetical protein